MSPLNLDQLVHWDVGGLAASGQSLSSMGTETAKLATQFTNTSDLAQAWKGSAGSAAQQSAQTLGEAVQSISQSFFTAGQKLSDGARLLEAPIEQAKAAKRMVESLAGNFRLNPDGTLAAPPPPQAATVTPALTQPLSNRMQVTKTQYDEDLATAKAASSRAIEALQEATLIDGELANSVLTALTFTSKSKTWVSTEAQRVGKGQDLALTIDDPTFNLAINNVSVKDGYLTVTSPQGQGTFKTALPAGEAGGAVLAALSAVHGDIPYSWGGGGAYGSGGGRDYPRVYIRKLDGTEVPVAYGPAGPYGSPTYGAPEKGGAGGTAIDGYDCSGFVQYAVSAGTKGRQVIGSNTYTQWDGLPAVPPSNLKAGDLVYYEPGQQGPEHVAMYVGSYKKVNGEWVSATGPGTTQMVAEAPQTGEKLQIRPMSQDGGPMGYRRPNYQN